ncbi:MAG: hypothetical protein ACRENP_29025 [Longimicrobiales bacterium]
MTWQPKPGLQQFAVEAIQKRFAEGLERFAQEERWRYRFNAFRRNDPAVRRAGVDLREILEQALRELLPQSGGD